ncbi:hypothetical protein CRE_27899 [Caenorhabditis remanei]|uniref:Uncharacterized protein n=1 Tax=Caenorhabditis remanei TaxID=31234 RepID=E3NI21_CAERE|nr:hypothetical protein CRE_27899 [Caenorhabditis remanei]
MSSPLSNIKTESRPIWEQPPPPNIVLPELPPEDPSRQMTLIEYLMLASAPEIARLIVGHPNSFSFERIY